MVDDRDWDKHIRAISTGPNKSEAVIDFDDIKGATIYDIWLGEDTYIRFRAITADGKGIEFQLPHVLDREDKELDITILPYYPLGDGGRT